MSQYFKGCFTFIKTADLLHLRFRPPPEINVTEDYIVLVKENRLGNLKPFMQEKDSSFHAGGARILCF